MCLMVYIWSQDNLVLKFLKTQVELVAIKVSIYKLVRVMFFGFIYYFLLCFGVGWVGPEHIACYATLSISSYYSLRHWETSRKHVKACVPSILPMWEGLCWWLYNLVVIYNNCTKYNVWLKVNIMIIML